MNNKKFLATCTLVAFGSTMLPAFAFAARVDETLMAAKGSTVAGDVTLSSGDYSDLTEITSVTKNGKEVTLKLAADNLSATVDNLKITFTDDTTDKVGFEALGNLVPDTVYGFALAEENGTTDTIYVKIVGSETTTAEPSANAAGKITVQDTSAYTAAANHQVVATDEYGKIASNTVLAKLDTNNDIDSKVVASLTENGYYGLVATGTPEKDAYADAVFQYTSDLKTAVEKAVAAADSEKTEAMAVINAALAAVEDQTVLVGDTKLVGSSATDYKLTTLFADQATAAKVDVSGLTFSIEAVVPAIAYYMNTDGTVVNTVFDDKTSVATTVNVKVTDGTYSNDKDVKIKLEKVKTVDMAEIVKSYAQTAGLTLKGSAPNFTSSLEVSNGDSIAMPKDLIVIGTDGTETKVSVALSSPQGLKAFKDAINLETGAIKTDATEDLKGKLTITLSATGETPQVITTDLTIKAAGEANPDLEEATKVFTEKQAAFNTVAEDAMKDGKVSKDELKAANAAYMELYKAYVAYVNAGGKA